MQELCVALLKMKSCYIMEVYEIFFFSKVISSGFDLVLGIAKTPIYSQHVKTLGLLEYINWKRL